MGLEDTVQQQAEQLLQRIRDLGESEIRAFVSDMLTSAAKERASVLDETRRFAEDEQGRAVRDESARVRAEVEHAWAAKLREATAAVEAAAVPAPEPLPPPPQIDDVVVRVRDGIRRLDRVRRLTDALDALGELAGREASRAAVLTVQDDRVRGWRFTAFEPALEPAHQVDLKIGEAGLVGHAVVTGATQSWVSGPDTTSGDGAPAFTVLPVGARALAVPVLVGGQVIAVLYGDDAAREPAAAWRASLEILASHAGHCMKSLTVARAAQLVSQEMPAVIADDSGQTLPSGEETGDRPESGA